MDESVTNRGGIYRVLNAPWVYWTARFVAAPGSATQLKRRMRRMVRQMPPAQRVLDVACGPASWLTSCGIEPIGVDLMENYVRFYTRRGGRAVVGAGDKLPFADESFDMVWCVALLHHLPDAMARQTVAQMLRVCRRGGTVTIIDGIYPDKAWHHPFAWLVRKTDRGQFMRTQQQMQHLLAGSRGDWQMTRFNLALTVLPMVWCTIRK